jgi:hypothetical protein
MVATRIRRGLLGAVAKWASPAHPELSTVVFRGKKMFATDGHRMVMVPTTFSSKTLFGVSRSDIIAAVAAQEALAKAFPSDSIESIEIAWDPDPPSDKVDRGDGQCSYPIEEVIEQNLEPNGAVRVIGCGPKFGDLGERPPLLLESEGGISFAIMPLRDL